MGRQLERMTQICVSLTEETTAGVVERMQELSGIADLFEVRADLVLDLDLLTILRAKTRPIMLTCRAESEGGRLADDDPRRRMMLLEAVKRGFDYVDVEYRSAFTDVMVEKAGRGLVVSYHDLKGTPEDLDGLRSMARAGEWRELVDLLVASLGSTGAPVTVAECGELRSLLAAMDMPGTLLAGLHVEG